MRSKFSATVNAYKIFNETMNQLSWLDSHVREGKDLEQALNFCRFVLWAGLVDFCEHHTTEDKIFRVNGKELRKKAEALQFDVQERYRANNMAPKILMTELEQINHKLELIAGQLSQISPRQTDTANSGNLPELQVIQGGVS